jgi:hypothetical protein
VSIRPSLVAFLISFIVVAIAWAGESLTGTMH